VTDKSAKIPLSLIFERLPGLANSDSVLLWRGRYILTEFMIEISDDPYLISIDHGQVASIRRGPSIMSSWSFAVRGGQDVWRAFWQPIPPPQYHDIFALAKSGAFRIEGNYRDLMTNLFYFKRLLAAPRALQSSPR
jgi:hypothetical protein